MEGVFFKLLNMSITAGYLVITVILIRCLFKRLPKKMLCFLWMFVAVRLLIPYSIESRFSLIPQTEVAVTVASQEDSESTKVQRGNSLSEQEDESVVAVESDVISEQTQDQDTYFSLSEDDIVHGAAMLWLIGVIALILHSLYTYIALRRNTACAVPLEAGVYQCDSIDTPFVLGVCKPRIYLPFSLEATDVQYVLAHERSHIARRDHWLKPVAFLILTVYWFHPLLWVAYLLLCRDIEFACDERVIEKFPAEERKRYSYSLLNCSLRRSQIMYCPVAFGEVGVKGRIQYILNYKKASFWIILSAIAVCVAVSVCFLTNPSGYMKVTEQLEQSVADAILENRADYTLGECDAEGHQILRANEKDGVITVYAICSFGQYTFENDNFIGIGGSGPTPTRLTFSVGDNGEYTLLQYKEPVDGSDYQSSIRNMFPVTLWWNVLHISDAIREDLESQRDAYATAYLETLGRKTEVGDSIEFMTTPLIEQGVSSIVMSIMREKFPEYPDYAGSIEKIEDGRRYVYEVIWDRTGIDTGTLTYAKYDSEEEEEISMQKVQVEGSHFEIAGADTTTKQYAGGYTDMIGEDGVRRYQIADGRIFDYRLELSGKLANSSRISTVVVLTNREDITFLEVTSSMFSSNTAEFLEDACVVELS